MDPDDNSHKDRIMSKIIEYKYPSSKISDIIQSYQFDSSDLGVRWEYEALQAWKNEASRIADEVMKAIDEKEREF